MKASDIFRPLVRYRASWRHMGGLADGQMGEGELVQVSDDELHVVARDSVGGAQVFLKLDGSVEHGARLLSVHEVDTGYIISGPWQNASFPLTDSSDDWTCVCGTGLTWKHKNCPTCGIKREYGERFVDHMTPAWEHDMRAIVRTEVAVQLVKIGQEYSPLVANMMHMHANVMEMQHAIEEYVDVARMAKKLAVSARIRHDGGVTVTAEGRRAMQRPPAKKKVKRRAPR